MLRNYMPGILPLQKPQDEQLPLQGLPQEADLLAQLQQQGLPPNLDAPPPAPQAPMVPAQFDPLASPPGPPAEIGMNPAAGQSQMAGYDDALNNIIANSQARQSASEPSAPSSLPKASMPAPAAPMKAEFSPPAAKAPMPPFVPNIGVNGKFEGDLSDQSLKSAYANQRDEMGNTAIAQGLMQAGAGLAGGKSPVVVTPDYSGLDLGERKAGNKIEEIVNRRKASDDELKREGLLVDLRHKESLADPNSPESEFVRNWIKKMAPGVQVPDNLSAIRLKELGFKIPTEQQMKGKFITLTDENGNPVVAFGDERTGIARPVQATGGLTSKKGFAPKINPITGQVENVSNITGKQNAGNGEGSDFVPNVALRKAIDKSQASMQSRHPGFKIANEFLARATDFQAQLAEAQKNPMSAAALAPELAKLYIGGVPPEKELHAYVSRPDIAGKVQSTLNRWVNGTIREGDAKLIGEALNAAKSGYQKFVDKAYDEQADSLSKAYDSKDKKAQIRDMLGPQSISAPSAPSPAPTPHASAPGQRMQGKDGKTYEKRPDGKWYPVGE